ncbi:MAG TPA: RNA-binding domain-containing protein [Methanotrichaceae archaeon]|nr:RNA-binding domain-containing protein [Methanotrichaceae archaeon]
MIHHIAFRAFAAATEDVERVKYALSIFVPLDSISLTEAEGHFENPICILQADLKKRDGRNFFELLREQLPKDDLERLQREIPQRTDQNGEFHMRLDKQAAYKGIIRLTDSKDAIDVSAHIATYPVNYEEALRKIGELL